MDVLKHLDKGESIPFYNQILENICFSDYIDRITFQKQIWIFNEMSSLIKTFYNHRLWNKLEKKKPIIFNPEKVRFTKVLTKYSTEYNNYLFIQNLCQSLNFDKKDLIAFFIKLKNDYENDEIYSLLDQYELTKLDINRIYRYIEKYTMYSENLSINNDGNLSE